MRDGKLFKETLCITRNWGINLHFYYKQVDQPARITVFKTRPQPRGGRKIFCPVFCLVND